MKRVALRVKNQRVPVSHQAGHHTLPQVHPSCVLSVCAAHSYVGSCVCSLCVSCIPMQAPVCALSVCRAFLLRLLCVPRIPMWARACALYVCRAVQGRRLAPPCAHLPYQLQCVGGGAAFRDQPDPARGAHGGLLDCTCHMATRHGRDCGFF